MKVLDKNTIELARSGDVQLLLHNYVGDDAPPWSVIGLTVVKDAGLKSQSTIFGQDLGEALRTFFSLTVK